MKILKHTLYDSNYAEIPCCHLSRKIPNDLNRFQLEYEDTINFFGQSVNRRYYIQCLNLVDPEIIEKYKKMGITDTNNINLGFGGPITLDLLYELHQIWFEQGCKTKYIEISSLADLIRRLGWTKSGKTYKLMGFHLEALFNIRVIAKTSLFNKNQKRLLSSTFHLFPRVNRKESDNNKSIIVAIDDYYYENIKNGCLIMLPFNREFFYSLKPLEKRISLYLSKIFNPRRKEYQNFSIWNRNLLQFAKQMPLLSNNKKVITQTVKRALNGLIEKKYPFLERYEIKNGIIKFICEEPVEFESKIDVNKFVDQSHTLERIRKKPDYVIDNIIEDCSRELNDYESPQYFKRIANTIDEDLIRQCISTAKQEGDTPKKYFRHLIKKYI